jgi:hypothetical protein
LGISGRSWSVYRRKARLMAIKGSVAILRDIIKKRVMLNKQKTAYCCNMFLVKICEIVYVLR